MVEYSTYIRATTHEFIYRLPKDRDKFECAVETSNIGADLHDKVAAVLVEAWETIFGDSQWRAKFNSTEMGKKSLDSKAVYENRRLYSASIGRKGKAMERILGIWGPEARPYLNSSLGDTFWKNWSMSLKKFLTMRPSISFASLFSAVFEQTRPSFYTHIYFLTLNYIC